MVTCPSEVLAQMAKSEGLKVSSEKFASYLDQQDELSRFRELFHSPDSSDDIKCTIYLNGNSLGLQPKSTLENITKVIESWRINTNHSHFEGFLPAAFCADQVTNDMADMIGASSQEVCLMNGLSVNLHLMMVSFYRPTPTRNKILIEGKAFPSDHYAACSQIEFHGYNWKECLLEVFPDEGKETVSMDNLCELIEKEGDSIALVLLPGVQYFTGQVFDMERITKIAHEKGCMVGFDLAHAVGNIELRLSDWGVDFACWCTYKYMNSGAGGIGGAFMHSKHEKNDLPKFVGWWGHRFSTRFDMSNKLDLVPGVQGYMISNPPPCLIAGLKSSLDIFKQTNMKQLCKKSFLLTGYLEFLLKEELKELVEIITPQQWRGCQLSVRFKMEIEKVYERLNATGVRCDLRKPSVMRLAPAPLYNSFKDVYNFVKILNEIILKDKQI